MHPFTTATARVFERTGSLRSALFSFFRSALAVSAFGFAGVSFFFAHQIYAYTQEPKSLDDRMIRVERQVDRVEERLDGTTRIHNIDLAALKASMDGQTRTITARLDLMEKRQFWLFTVAGGVGTIAGGGLGLQARKKLREGGV